MLKVALTGGIATGKSYVRQRLAARGVPSVDADTLAREVVEPGTPGRAAIAARFGRDVFDPDGRLDRKALSAIVFRNDAARADLEAIVHPAVYSAIGAWFAEQAGAGLPFAVADIPLLYESGHAGDFDAVIVAACHPDRQRERLIARDGLTAEEAAARLSAQWPIERKVDLADFVIRTDGTFADTDVQVDAALNWLRARAAENGKQASP
jgi:dephospho-CoA kinase